MARQSHGEPAGKRVPEFLNNTYPGDTEMIALPLINALRSWRSRSRVSLELSSMTDSQLADIGISRGDIDAVVHGRFVRRARTYS